MRLRILPQEKASSMEQMYSQDNHESLRIPCRAHGDISLMKEMIATSKVKPVTQNSKEHLKSKEICYQRITIILQ